MFLHPHSTSFQHTWAEKNAHEYFLKIYYEQQPNLENKQPGKIDVFFSQVNSIS